MICACMYELKEANVGSAIEGKEEGVKEITKQVDSE